MNEADSNTVKPQHIIAFLLLALAVAMSVAALLAMSAVSQLNGALDEQAEIERVALTHPSSSPENDSIYYPRKLEPCEWLYIGGCDVP